jgi:hypothetical protein
MPELDDSNARLVARETEVIARACLKVHRTLFREALASDPSIGTGRPDREAEEASDLGQRFRSTSYDEPVFLGFWWSGGKGFTCSVRGFGMRDANRVVSPRTIDLANTRVAKEGGDDYLKFLEVNRKLIEIDPEPAMRTLTAMLRTSQRDGPRHGTRARAEAFFTSEAEARAFAYLMHRKDVSGFVHFYTTQSPCGACCQTYAELGPMYAMYENIRANPPAHGARMFLDFRTDFEAAGFDRWKVGGLYYGCLYTGLARPTNLNVLTRAVQYGGIRGYKQI